jgi:hypothetical protein
MVKGIGLFGGRILAVLCSQSLETIIGARKERRRKL